MIIPPSQPKGINTISKVKGGKRRGSIAIEYK